MGKLGRWLSARLDLFELKVRGGRTRAERRAQGCTSRCRQREDRRMMAWIKQKLINLMWAFCALLMVAAFLGLCWLDFWLDHVRFVH